MAELEIGWIGFGAFGRFAVPHLSTELDVVVADRGDVSAAAADVGVAVVPVAEAARRSIVILAVPVQNLDELLLEISPHLREDALVIEVGSVKVRPAELLEQRLGADVRFLGLHPMFGPQSGRNGLAGLKVVVCRPSRQGPRDEELACIKRYLSSLELELLEMEAVDHDRDMAYVQGLTHWMAKALREIHLPDLRLATPAYRHLLKIEEILREDSLDLFLTIQRENPFAEAARRELEARLSEIEEIVHGAGDDEAQARAAASRGRGHTPPVARS